MEIYDDFQGSSGADDEVCLNHALRAFSIRQLASRVIVRGQSCSICDPLAMKLDLSLGAGPSPYPEAACNTCCHVRIVW